jgi:hypothetical protein
MQVRGLFVLAGALSCLAGPLGAQQDPVRWLTNYDDAVQEAKRTRKPIFLEFRCEP